ncbi:predicted protein [Streptomyces sp. SPB78]|nr:predicted protein [Streptomyces sp. SPB78]
MSNGCTGSRRTRPAPATRVTRTRPSPRRGARLTEAFRVEAAAAPDRRGHAHGGIRLGRGEPVGRRPEIESSVGGRAERSLNKQSSEVQPPDTLAPTHRRPRVSSAAPGGAAHEGRQPGSD